MTTGVSVERFAPAAAAVLIAFAAPTAASALPHHSVVASHACTRTSRGTCIRGGELCPQAKYGKKGWDAKGRVYVCKGDHTHPHREKP
jgi:hypothetical protein